MNLGRIHRSQATKLSLLMSQPNRFRTARFRRVILGKRKAIQPFPLSDALLAKKRKEIEKVIGIQRQAERKEQELDKIYRSRDEAVACLFPLDP